MFLCKIDSPEVKEDVIPSTMNFIWELPHELPNDLRLRILGNFLIMGKISNLDEDTRYCLVSLQKNQFLTKAVRTYAKADIKVF